MIRLPDLLRQCAFLASGVKRSVWAGLVLLAVLVSGLEGYGAVAVYRFVGDLTRRRAGIADAIAVGAIFVARGLAVLLQAKAHATVTERAGARLASRLHNAYLHTPYDLYATRNSAQQLRDAHDTVQLVLREVLGPLPRLMSESILVVALTAVLVVTSPLATLMAACVLFPVGLFLSKVVHPVLERRVREHQVLTQASLSALQESVQGLPDIRLSGKETYFQRRFQLTRDRLAQVRADRAVLLRLPAIGVETALVAFVIAYLSLSIGAPSTRGLAVLGLFGYVSMRLRPSLDVIAHGVSGLRSNRPAIEQLRDELLLLEGPRPHPGPPLPFVRQILLEDVTLQHRGAAAPAIRNVSLSIQRGHHVGLVGPTGGGKTTLVELLVGLQVPTSGAVYVDDVDIATCGPQWQERLGVVPQFPSIFDDTLARNIALGVDDDDIDYERVSDAVELAQLQHLLAGLPDGIHTRVGERGVRLSGGQRQRLAIARAVYRDPEVLVFDEGTAALDTVTEAALMNAVHRMRGNRTVVVVAHRLTTVRDCDAIHLVEDGRISASGTYDELLERSDRFRQMVSG